MNENLNLVEIVKDCPEGTKLYSTVFGEVELNVININSGEPIYILVRDGEVGCEKVSLAEDGRLYCGCNGECTLFPSKDQRDWSKFKIKKPKFDPKTLKPFDKVLAIDSIEGQWRCTFYSHERKDIYKYVTTDYIYNYCIIPYNDDTKHLVGTANKEPEFYRYWED